MEFTKEDKYMLLSHELKLSNIEKTIDLGFSRMDKGFERMDKKFDKINSKFDTKVSTKIFIWLFGFMIFGVVSVCTYTAKLSEAVMINKSQICVLSAERSEAYKNGGK